MSQSGATDPTTQVISRSGRAKDRLEEVAAEHPDVPRLVILKTDVQRRGVNYTGSALRLLDPSLHQAEWLAERGVTTVFSLWKPPSCTFLGNASLDFLIRLAKGFHRIRRSHGLTVEYGDYRRGGNHPDLDLDRLQN